MTKANNDNGCTAKYMAGRKSMARRFRLSWRRRAAKRSSAGVSGSHTSAENSKHQSAAGLAATAAMAVISNQAVMWQSRNGYQ